MTVAVGHQDPAFVHEAFLYRGPDEFLRGMLQFIRDGIEAGEPVFVVLSAEKIARLREALGEDADRVLFASDCPFDPEKGPGYIRETIEVLEAIDMPQEMREKIAYKNAQELFGLK